MTNVIFRTVEYQSHTVRKSAEKLQARVTAIRA